MKFTLVTLIVFGFILRLCASAFLFSKKLSDTDANYERISDTGLAFFLFGFVVEVFMVILIVTM